MITSIHNPKIQWVRKLQAQPKARWEERLFVVEGVRLAEEALRAGWEARLVLHSGQLSPRGQAAVSGFTRGGALLEEVSEAVMKAACQTETPQGILAVLALRELPLPTQPDFLLLLDSVRDPGNLGTLLRTAAAAGVQAVLLPPGTADAYAPKVVRAGMGAHFHLPVRSLEWGDIQAYLAGLSPALRMYLADAQGGIPYTQADLCVPLALVIGGEATGAGQAAARLANQRLHIPMPGGMESLNAAVAAAVLMFEVVRQRQ